MHTAKHTDWAHSYTQILRACVAECQSAVFSRQFSVWARHLATIVLAAAAYGFTVGIWRAPMQGVFTAIKFPLLIVLTTLINGLMNGLYAGRMGLPLNIVQSTKLILLSYLSACSLLGALSPILLFLTLQAPQMDSADALLTHRILLLLHVGTIACAGVLAHMRLYELLKLWCVEKRLAGRILSAWMLGNLLVGAQLSWNLRPFVGAPTLAVAFLRQDAFDGTFYEAVYRSAKNILWRNEK